MKIKPKLFLGLVALVIIAIVAIVLPFHLKRQTSLILLSAHQNKFKINFHLTEKDKGSFSKLQETLGLSKDLENGFEFELDATSSAKLAYLAPDKINLDFRNNDLDFWGEIKFNPFERDYTFENLKIPKSTNLALFSPNLLGFVTERYNLPEDFKKWANDNISGIHPQYLIVFGPESDFVLIFKSQAADLSTLKNLNLDAPENTYKEEIQDNITIFLLNLSTKSSQKTINPALFKIGEWTFFASSGEAAKQILSFQKDPKDYQFLLDNPKVAKASLIIKFTNDSQALPPNFASAIFTSTNLTKGEDEIIKALEKINKIDFVLSLNDFSGLISIK